MTIPTEPSIRVHLKPHQHVFVGVVATSDPRIETPKETTTRETAFAKIRARVAGTALSSAVLTGR